MKKFPALCILAAAIAAGCVKVDGSLGKGLVDKNLLYDTYTVEFPLQNIQQKRSSDLSGYSDSRVVIGAIRDATFGLTTRESAFTLVPVLDTIDLGTGPVAKSLDLYFSADTVSCADDSQARILQNIYVTELTEVLDTKKQKTDRDISHGTESLTSGIPVYNGSGALTFNLKADYAQKIVDAIVSLAPDGVLVDRSWDSDKLKSRFDDYVNLIPGVYLSCQEPSGIGGRINLLNLSCLSVSNNYYVRNNNVAYLKVNSTWDGVQKDSTFLLVPGEMEFVDEYTYLENNNKFTQYAFNRTSHTMPEGAPVSDIYIEGGGGIKPVVQASEIRDNVLKEIQLHNGNVSNTIISKATIVLPFEMPADYRDMKYFPTILSPTIQKTVTDDDGNSRITFAGLTDASVSTENQGDIDRSNLMYSPDISYHVQEILSRTDLDTATDADIWLLTIHTNKVANANGSLYDNDYYQSLLYASYYNSLYGGGYGGYGYGSYGGYDSYSNYYSYMMLAQMMAASSQQTYSYTTELDKDRYYKGVLNGKGATRYPMCRVTFSISKK